MPISGKEMLKMYLKKGWIIRAKRGSHIKVIKIKDEKKLVETIPQHKKLNKGLEIKLLKRLKEL